MGVRSRFCQWLNVPQIKALLWKDVLIKKRQPVCSAQFADIESITYR